MSKTERKAEERRRIAQYRVRSKIKPPGPLLERRAAIFAGHARYAGRVCEYHPDLVGERFTLNSACPGCRSDKSKRTVAARKAGEAAVKADARDRARLAGDIKYVGKVCVKHPELKGLRYVTTCLCPTCVTTKAKKHQLAKKLRIAKAREAKVKQLIRVRP